MKKPIQSNPISYLLSILTTTLLLLPDTSVGDPRDQKVRVMCGNQPEHNVTIFVPNFFATMESIRVQMRTSGFGIAGTGSGPDAAYGLAQCYGDISLPDCVICHAGARTDLPQCFPANGGHIFLNGCFMRYENYSFFQEYSGPQDTAVCGNLTQKNSAFEDSARQAVKQVVANGPNGNGFARAKVAVSGAKNESVYVLADCWRTLSADSCRACLQSASQLVSGCLPWSEGRALNTGCFLMYSDTDFLNPVVGNGNSRVSVAVIVVLVVSSVLVLAVGGIIGVHMWKHRVIEKKRRGSNDAEKLVKTLHDSSLNFKYSTLEKATGSFDEANKLGHGGFGSVYKGVLPDGREIAVKRLFFNNRHRAADFYNEVNIISSVEHKNLVRLLGCSCSGPESLLVYEFLPNRSLDRFIFNSDRGKTLNWEKRYEIVIGTAEGLVYLHENNTNRIIHRDIKASNILLDSRLRAKIADFGLARLLPDGQSHLSTNFAGTLGYTAPEYAKYGQLTEKVDTYSFGVVVLEIISGQRCNETKVFEVEVEPVTEFLLEQAWKLYEDDKHLKLVDEILIDSNGYTDEAAKKIIEVALMCTQTPASSRPTMSEVVMLLSDRSMDLMQPTRHAFMDNDKRVRTDTSNTTGSSKSNATASFTEFGR